MKPVLLGKIVGTHGVRGEVKVLSDSDFKSDRFAIGNTLYILDNNTFMPIVINSYRVHKGLDLIKFNSIDDINECLPYVGKDLYVDYSTLEGELGDGEVYVEDLIDIEVYDTENFLIGRVVDIRHLPQGEILEIIDINNKKFLLPFVDEFIIDIDLNEEKVIVHLIEGIRWE